jgi:DNA-binding NarL/FixJ family response regulator
MVHPDSAKRPSIPPAANNAVLGRTARAIVLIVEDDFFVGAELEQGLREAGFMLLGIAATSAEALALAESGKPTLAIMDVRLAEEGDGVETAIELFTRFGICSVFASAHGHKELKDRAMKAEPIAWLQKPYTADAVIAEILRAQVKVAS